MLVKVSKAIANFGPCGKAPFRTWLTTICRNTLVDERRRRPTSVMPGACSSSPAAVITALVPWRQYWQAILRWHLGASVLDWTSVETPEPDRTRLEMQTIPDSALQSGGTALQQEPSQQAIEVRWKSATLQLEQEEKLRALDVRQAELEYQALAEEAHRLTELNKEGGVVTTSTVANAQRQMDQAMIQLERAKLQYELTREQLKRYETEPPGE